MADEYQMLRDLLTNGAGGAGTGLAVVYLWMRYGRAWSTGGQTGLTSAEARAFIEEQRERLRNWFDEARMRIRDLEVTMDKIEETQEKLLAVSNQTVNEQRTQTEIQRAQTELLRRIDMHLYRLGIRLGRAGLRDDDDDNGH